MNNNRDVGIAALVRGDRIVPQGFVRLIRFWACSGAGVFPRAQNRLRSKSEDAKLIPTGSPNRADPIVDSQSGFCKMI